MSALSLNHCLLLMTELVESLMLTDIDCRFNVQILFVLPYAGEDRTISLAARFFNPTIFGNDIFGLLAC